MRVFLDGRAVPLSEARVPVDRGLLLGDGLFETLEVLDGRARFLERHLARLDASARTLGFAVPGDLAERVGEALPVLHAGEGSPARAALRITVTRAGGRGLDVAPDAPVAVLIGLTSLPTRARGVPSAGVAAVVTPDLPLARRDLLGAHKTTSRAGYQAARARARAAGADRALRPFDDGRLACGDAANVFVVRGGDVLTPSGPGRLPGVTRARLLEAGLGAREADVPLAELAHADEVFLTNALCGVEPVSRLDGRDLAAPGPVALAAARALDA